MKTGILFGIIALGIAAIAFAAEGSGVSADNNHQGSTQRDLAYEASQNMSDYQGAPTTNMPNNRMCSWSNTRYQNAGDCSMMTNQSKTTKQNGCDHWFRRFMPGHSTRCGWNNNGNATQTTNTGCCW